MQTDGRTDGQAMLSTEGCKSVGLGCLSDTLKRVRVVACTSALTITDGLQQQSDCHLGYFSRHESSSTTSPSPKPLFTRHCPNRVADYLPMDVTREVRYLTSPASPTTATTLVVHSHTRFFPMPLVKGCLQVPGLATVNMSGRVRVCVLPHFS